MCLIRNPYWKISRYEDDFNENATNIMKQFDDNGIFYKAVDVYGPCILVSDHDNYNFTLDDYNYLMFCIGHKNIKKATNIIK